MAIYQKISKNIQKAIIDNPATPEEKLVWINISNAGRQEIDYLRKKYNFRLAHLKASSGKTSAQRATLEKTPEDYLFLILHFPIFENEAIVPAEIDFFVGPDYLVTLHNDNIRSFNAFFNHSKKDSADLAAFEFESPMVLLYEILNSIMNGCDELLDEFSIDLSGIEQVIFAQRQKRAVSDILLLRRNIINTRRIMQNHKNIIKKLIFSKDKHVPEDRYRRYYNRLLEQAKRFWENLEIQKEMIEVLNSTNESMLNYRTNDVMRTLTIFSVIVFPLTLLAAIFGMNTMEGMPFVHTPFGFWIIIGIMLTGCLGMIFYFHRKKWL